ncbi:hypothetical protein FNO01nite_35060 [Flavobacterium noncentrifugens]|uniref:Uncharacterized protein n=1 Tax=Flavobacterium noncentrifugens TaxID=1128970 RepID=A0A1G9DG15_9FLAO|nr:hypothetical protein [Flavobacterium noncentrifugens]GEP52834.1 hypothetical protein FNO01nite_35060 [Flavobacterium noncentrifugens]SDK62793.1 hypothetical protein SAMN04487935_3810 [Flavobacterium noncentrifugens]
MAIFPQNNYSIEITGDNKSSLSKLKSQTLPKDQFVTNWDNQIFIGEIQEDEFEIHLSKKIIGEICILKGKFDDQRVTLSVQTGKIFKILLLIITLFSFSGIIVSIIQNKLEAIFPLVMIILVMRFIFLELGFRFFSKSAINKLTEIIGIQK